jgi:hypothetical protein
LQGIESQELSLFERYEMQGVLVEALEKTVHHRDLAEKVQNCHKTFRGRRCDQNHTWAESQNSCSCRLCPHCSHRRAGVLGARVELLVQGKEDLRYVVLAEGNSKNLKSGIDSLYEAWTRLRRSVRWKRKVKGCIAVFEVTYNENNATWHPHLNVLVEGDYFPFAELNLLWKKATKGKGQTTHIQQADEGTVRELLKYTFKIAERNEDGELKLILDGKAVLDQYIAAVYGMRLVRTYGTFHGLQVEDEGAPEEQCPDCGSKCIVDIGPIQHSQLSFDFAKGVFRVACRPTKRDHALHFVRECPPPTYSTSPEAIAVAVEARRRRTSYERSVCELFAEVSA